ncbi:hypothetical protein [Acinetobacter pseudolwoffii]|uniref:hypothetical protein n=1 Tax=Acinetobacter pseudolwoffii TaxID=2053287 RepID=UPI000C2340B4|nr:hypothetical protein [Acinetobacter pseudolwoffii]PJI34360.1 hypothetical protein CU318_12520 [Acinetobacter pseudolwoffii]
MEKFELEIADQNIVVAAFRKPGGTTELFERIAQEARSHVPDVTTKKGREQIGSLAMKVSKSKTFIEKCGKELVADEKARIKVIDDDRIATVKKFDELRNEILAPRDAWEQAEKDRVQAIQDKIAQFDSGRVDIGSPLNLIVSVIAEIEAIVIDESFAKYQEQAKLQKYECLEVLRKVQVEREKYEAEQAELERLRQAEQARLQREHEERIAREAAEKATREAEEKARFEAERVQREKTEAEQREARLKAEKEAAELRAVQAAENERKRIEAEQAAKAEAERKAEEARLADEAHTKKVCAEALEHLALLPGVNEQLAKSILAAIYKGRIPHVSIKF